MLVLTIQMLQLLLCFESEYGSNQWLIEQIDWDGHCYSLCNNMQQWPLWLQSSQLTPDLHFLIFSKECGDRDDCPWFVHHYK